MKSECEKIKDQIADYASGILPDAEAADLQRHLKDCRSCREYARALKDEDKLLTALFAEIDTNMDARQQRVLNEINRSSQSEQNKTIPIWVKIMRNRITKLAAAAVILIGILVLASVFVGTNKSVALAGVLEKVEQARAFMYKMDMTMTGSMMQGGKHEVRGTIIISDEYGMKYEMYTPDPDTGEKAITEMYILLDKKLAISLMPEQKKYLRMEFDDDWLAVVKREKNDPRETLKRMMDCNYNELGRKEIDGIKVEGFETTDPKFSEGLVEGVKVTLWVDVKTWLPVLWEMDIEKNKLIEIQAVISDFQWDIPVVASDFEPVIPKDYTDLSTDGDKAPKLSEEMTLNKDAPAGTDCCERGEAYYFDGEYDQAILELTKAIEINPGLARAYVTRGITYEDKNEHDLAIADFTKVIEIKPTDAHAYVYRGMVFKNKGEYTLAIADYSKAIEIDPTISDAYKGRASAYTTQGEYDKAWKDVYQAQAMGRPVDPKLLEKLRKASGRDE